MELLTESVADWLRYIKNAGDSLTWLAPYEDNLLNILNKGLNHERQFRKSYELLTIVFPYFALSLSHTDLWSPLLRDALLMAQDIKDNDLQVKVFRWMGESYLKSGEHQTARKAFSTALQRAEVGEIDYMIVAVYTGLFKLQWFDLKQDLTQTLVNRAMETAARTQDPALQADLFDALAPAYARLMDTDVALGYGQTAFAYWNSTQNHSAMGRTAYTIAGIYMQIAKLKDDMRFLPYAMSFLEIARSELAQTDELWQYPLLAYIQATIYFQLENFEVAESWYQQALSEAERMNSPQYVVISQHGLGLSQARLEKYESARHYLNIAFNHWDKFNNDYEKASVLAGFADLELRAGDHIRAKRYISRGVKATTAIQDSKMRAFMEAQFREISDRLDE